MTSGHTSSTSFEYIITHIFLPVQLPKKTDYTPENDLQLLRLICTAAHAYAAYTSDSYRSQWFCITKMLDNLQASIRSVHLDKDLVASQLDGVETGNILTLFVRPRNTALLIRKHGDRVLIESFEVSPSEVAVKETGGPLICQYPDSAVEIPDEVFVGVELRSKLIDFVSLPHAGSVPPSGDGQMTTALFFGELRGVSCAADVPYITKRIRDDIRVPDYDDVRDDTHLPGWRRSSLWLLIRVAIQIACHRSSLGRPLYKQVLLFFMCTLAVDENNLRLSDDLLHFIACKILRRLNKFGPSIPEWLSEMAFKACASVRKILDTRRMNRSIRPSAFRNPSQDELIRDSESFLENTDKHVHEVLANLNGNHDNPPFRPGHRPRGTIKDFLSSNGAFFTEGCATDKDVTLWDVEKLVEQGIFEDWVANVTNVDEACSRIEILMDAYLEARLADGSLESEERSIELLTGIELFVAVDKLVAREIPILADYSPEIPLQILERLLLRHRTSLHRLSCTYQYLATRHSHSLPGWSVLSDNFTEDSFPVRYYDQSRDLQELKVRIEANTRSLPVSSLLTKVVVFELQCPTIVRVWRSSVARILHHSHISRHSNGNEFSGFQAEKKEHLLARDFELGRHLVWRNVSALHVQLHFTYFYPEGKSIPTACYAVEYLPRHDHDFALARWQPSQYEAPSLDSKVGSLLLPASEDMHSRVYLKQYASTSHTSNHVLACQIFCPPDFSLDEFLAFAHLRAGGSLQWPNILHGLRSRRLSLRRIEVHCLISHTVLQVGPLDLNTGTFVWHEELQDLSFCNALLDELEILFSGAIGGSVDAVLMCTISLLLTRVVEMSPSESISDRSAILLRRIRSHTLTWIEELLYNLAVAPANEERGRLLLDMAVTCQSTFDVGPGDLPKLLCSAEDVDAALSCAFLTKVLCPKDIMIFYDHGLSKLLFRRNRRISLALENLLKDAILADPSEYGIDLAVRKVFGHKQLGTQRWEPLQYPDERWMKCKPEIINQCSRTIHVNLLTGELRVDGQLLPGLPFLMLYSPEWQYIFRGRGFLLLPSNLPTMDFTTHTITPGYRIHFSLRDGVLAVQAQHNHTGNILQYIPRKALGDDIPSALINNHVLWLDLSTKTIEMHPVGHTLESSSEHWKIDFASGRCRLYKGCYTLVNMRSQTWKMVLQCFRGLQPCSDHPLGPWLSNNLLVATSPVDPLQPVQELHLSVVLPAYSLSFFVNVEGELESCDFKDMVYDENQCIGTLFGLDSLLVLRSRTHIGDGVVPEGLIFRRVLIPDGRPEKLGTDRIWIDCARTSVCHAYDVDTELGRLNGDGSMRSTELLAYLHEMTSFNHWPDPLTRKSGSEAALCILRSGGCRSVFTLKALSFDHPPRCQSPRYVAAHQGIERNYYWKRYFDFDIPAWTKIMADDADASLERTVQRASHLESTTGTPTGPSATKNNSYDSPSRSHVAFQMPLYQLFSSRLAPELPARTPSILLHKTGENVPINTHELSLKSFFSSLPVNESDPIFQREYIALLENSAQSARENPRRTSHFLSNSWVGALEGHYIQCRSAYFNALDALRRCLDPTTGPLEKALQQFGLWPPITGDSLLQCLASASPIASEITPSWKKCLTSFALLLLDLQRSRRLLLFALRGLEEEFSKELENEPCDGWDPEEYPDWLLIQIQGNFLIHRAQAETAMEMMFPKSGENTLMQVNMGEGKSSVVIPMIAAALANGKQLVRVVVPKALTMQMFEILVARLGGLANRPIYSIPLSRNSLSDINSGTNAHLYQEMILQCMEEHGILLVEPAHIASLKLMSTDKQIRNGTRKLVDWYQLVKSPYDPKHLSLISLIEGSFLGQLFRSLSQLPARHCLRSANDLRVDDHKDTMSAMLGSPSVWLALQKWVDCYARDILDESDEILHTRTQFVYANGHRQHVDGYPERWIIIQRVLGLVKERAHTLSKNHHNSILEYDLGPPGSFPHIHLVLSSNVGRRLISLIVEDVMDGQLSELNFRNVTPVVYDAIRAFISDDNVLRLPDTVKIVEDFAKKSQYTNLWNALLLLRGLLASGILLFTLAERRWRIDYGLAPRNHHHEDSHSTSNNRATTLLSVPYRAKDMPAPHTQFGHPDITIILTCLSYYYAGLTEDQLRASFELLLDEGDPSMEYAHWVKEYDPKSLPASLQTLGDIMLRSSEQWDKVTFPLFTRNQATINFYLSRVVFPKEAQGFPWKICASGWDLAEKRENLITGFSGTNDGRWLLPTGIAQRDLDHQKGTNVKIISYLLLPENDSYTVTHENGERWNTFRLLQVVAKQRPQIRVLVDVGAQILDLSNIQLAKEWLDIDRDAFGAVYFSKHDELMVLTRAGTEHPLISSPLSQQLHRCVVYLDHAHTRGTDLKLPNGSRAAVTLGPRLTKDSLVQGCMRMRKLGQPNGHSVMFFAPLEVDQSIRIVAGKKDPNTRITAVDVLCWTIQETWNDIQRRAPYWAQQGMSHRSRHEAWSRFCKGDITSDKLADAWLEPERKTLNDLYAPREVINTPNSLSQLDPDILQRCNTLGVLSLPTATLDEGQEREVNQEREREREIEIPPWASPLDHVLHPDVVNFVKTGTLPLLNSDSESAFVPVFTTLEKSTASTRDANVWSPSILATSDFCRTVDPDSTAGSMDQYLRPVQWVLTRRNIHDQVLVLLSPFEVGQLLPDIRESEHVHLHLYAPRTVKNMKPSDDLRLYTIPPLPSEWNPPWTLIDQLNIFAGQLYLSDYQSYLRLCRFLGIPTTESETSQSGEIHWNRLKIPGSFEEEEIRFSNSPLPFVSALLCIRNRGQPFGHTHMGRILQGEVLSEKDFRRSPAYDTQHVDKI